MLDDELPFKVVRANTSSSELVQSVNLLLGRAAYETAVRLYPKDRIDYRCGVRVIERSCEEG
jgi:hypothetical protein